MPDRSLYFLLLRQALTAAPGDGRIAGLTTSRASSQGCAAATSDAAATTSKVVDADWVAQALEFRPTLPRLHLLACLCSAAAAAAAAFRAVPGGAWGAALLFAVLAAASLGWLRERQFKVLQRCERDLAGPASRFHLVDGVVEYHYTQHSTVRGAQPGGDADLQAPTAAPQPPLLVHCVHGLGASSFSWDGFVQQDLARALGSRAVVTAHDMPGFGLTQR